MNNYLKSFIYTGIFTVPFVIFIVSGSLLFPFITGKAFIFRIIVEIIFGLWLVLILRDGTYSPRSSLIIKTISAFVLIVLIADIFAVNSFKAFWSNYERMEGFIAIIHLYAYFLVIGSMLRTKEMWNRFWATNIGVSAIMAIYSFLQLAGKITIHQGGVRVDGTFGNASYLAIYMVFNIFLATILFLQSKSKFQKIALTTIGIMDLVVLYYTATRGAILGIVGGAFISFVYLSIKAERGEPIRKIALAFMVSIVVLAGAFWMVKDTSAVKNNPVLGRFSTLSFSEIKTQGRYFVWPMAWKASLEKPILGWGQEGFNYAFNKYYDVRMYAQEPWFDRTHNIILDWLISAGLLGLLSYLLIFAALFVSLNRSNEQILKEEKALIYGLIIAYLFHNLFVFDQIGSYIMFFSILAYIHSLSSKSFEGRIANGYEKQRIFLAGQNIRPISDSLVLILVIVSLYFVNYIPWKQNVAIISALRANVDGVLAPIETYAKPLSGYNMGSPEALDHVPTAVLGAIQKTEATEDFRQKAFKVVDNAFKKHIERAPYDVRGRIFYSLFLSGVGLYDGSLAQLNEAIKFSPEKQSIYIEMGSQLIMSGKTTEALQAFKKAYELEPSSIEALFAYGMGAVYAKDNKLADELLKGVPESKLISDDRYMGALFSTGRYNEVINIMKKRIENDPINTQHRITLASVYLKVGMRDAAIGEIEQIIKINPSFKDQGEYYIKEIRAGRNP